MPEQSLLRLVKRSTEYLPKEAAEALPRGLRGIYVLYHRRGTRYEVVYVGKTNAGGAGGIRGRIRRHRKKKNELFTHFSAYEVWDNIRNEEVAELKGLFRHIYRADPRANRLNVQRGFKKLKQVDRIVLKDNAI